MKKWIKAFRLRTLPLALACVGMGSFLAFDQSMFKINVLLLSLLTTIFLQILSNLSNDYGDYINGADHIGRKGPQRAVQSGEISPSSMKKAIVVFIILSLISGTFLLVSGLKVDFQFLLFFALGIFAIGAALYYTMGRKPYGYAGLGDPSVFIFFGLIGVCGTYYLHTGMLDWLTILPACSCGFFAVGVLNVNNIRDIESDRKAGKKSIPVRLGRRNAILYHFALLILGLLTSLIYILIQYESLWQLLFILVIPLLVNNARGVSSKSESEQLDPYLKQLALTTLAFVVLFGSGLIIN